jgi:hypothetical protein
MGIQRCRRFIGKDQTRRTCQRARHSNPLLLPTAQVSGKGIVFVTEINLVKQALRFPLCLSCRHSLEVEREFHVLADGQSRKKIEALKYEPNVLQPDAWQFPFRQAGNVFSGDPHASR